MSPRGLDYVIDPSQKKWKGKAYDAAKAKFLARAFVGGMPAAQLNVDNYVYFALWHYVLNRWDVKANKPAYGWPIGVLDAAGYTDYPDGDPTISAAEYTAYVNETALNAGGFEDYSGAPCSTDADCEGTCPPDMTVTAMAMEERSVHVASRLTLQSYDSIFQHLQ